MRVLSQPLKVCSSQIPRVSRGCHFIFSYVLTVTSKDKQELALAVCRPLHSDSKWWSCI